MKIAFILFTNGLEYDDRIRKEMFSMRELLGDVEFKVFAFHGDNHSETGVLSYGVPYEIISLNKRGGSKSLISQLRKEYDFFSQIKKKVRDYDWLWVCDDQPFFFPLLSKKPIIWDLHEIPASIIGSRIKNILFHRMERRCKWMIHANQERLDYLVCKGIVKHPEKNLILRNYPDHNWLSEGSNRSESFNRFYRWLGENEYIYIQGITGDARFPWETLSSIMQAKCIKAVIIGKVPNEVRERVSATYPDVDKYLYYAGQMVQSETAAFLANCHFSMVFYDDKSPNNLYCEPNRMFQSLGLGKPVIVGYNDPMKNVIDKYGNGVVLPSTGSCIEDNINGIRQMMESYAAFMENASRYKDVFLWESQNALFKQLFGVD